MVYLATTDLVLRTESQPGCKGGSVAKPGHIGADLAEDGLGCNRADARHVGEIDSADSIQLTAEVERLRLIPASLICGRLGSFGYRWLRSRRCLQSAELTLNLLIHLNDQLLVVAERSQRLSEREQVLWAIVTLKRFRDRVLTAFYATMTEPSQDHRILFASEDCIQYPEAAHSGDVVQDAVNLEIHLI